MDPNRTGGALIIGFSTAWVLFMLAPAVAQAQTVYRCETAEGIEFSSAPCADDAERIELEVTSPPPRPVVGRREEAPRVDMPLRHVELLRLVPMPASVITSLVGKPAAVFADGDIDHWLYPNACVSDGRFRRCIEVLLRDGRSFELVWLADDVMQRSVQIARGFSGWMPPAKVAEKLLAFVDTPKPGWAKSRITAMTGQPDIKKVSNGIEIWEYHQVRFEPTAPEPAMLAISFDGDIANGVTTSATTRAR